MYAAAEDTNGENRGLYRCPDENGDDTAELCEQVSAYPSKAVHMGIDGAPLMIDTGGLLLRFSLRDGKTDALAAGLGGARDFAVTREGDWLASGRDAVLHILPGAETADDAPIASGALDIYEGRAYPDSYQGAVFAAAKDRIVILRPYPCGARLCSAAPKTFLQGGTHGVTDVKAGPDGAMWFTTAGGSLYRVVYRPGLMQQAYYRSEQPRGIQAVVRQPQPLSSWGHASLLRAKAAMGESAWKQELWKLALDRSAEPRDRVQAVLILDRIGPRATAELLRPMGQDGNAAVRAAAIQVASFHSSDRAKAIVSGGLNDVHPFVRRRAFEGMVRMGLKPENHSGFAPAEIVLAGLNDSDPWVRRAARLALEKYPREQWSAMALRERSGPAVTEALYAMVRTAQSPADLDAVFQREIVLLRNQITPERLRAFQWTAGRASEAVKREVYELVAPRFPDSEESLSREMARTLASTNQPEAIQKILDAVPKGEEQRSLRMDYVSSLRRIDKGWTDARKRALAELADAN
jgi:HEAT repeat protein